MDRRKGQHGDGAGFRLLAIAYLFWALLVTLVRAAGSCAVESLCRVGGSGHLSTLVTAVPLALILGSLTTKRCDEGTRLMAIAITAAALILAPALIGDFVGLMFRHAD